MKHLSSIDGLLVALVALVITMTGFRVWYFGSTHYIFLVINLALAAIPWRLGKWVVRQQYWRFYAALALWLLFLPNAMYIVTDLVHLHNDAVAPVWYDTLLIFAAAIAGLFMGFTSLLEVEQKLKQLFMPRTVSIIIGAILFLSAFGVYLGRFLRWYSWDIITRPLALLESIIVRIVFPFDHIRTWGMTTILTLLFMLCYAMLKQLRQAPLFSATDKRGIRPVGER